MTILDDIFSNKNIRKIWRKLRDSHVPIVNAENYSEVADFRVSLLQSIKNTSYMPNTGHGYLGFPKSNGCTRFVPVLAKEDMTVFYLLSLAIQDQLAHDQPNVFGGWQSIPKRILASKSDNFEIYDPYYNETFNSEIWFKNWTSFNELLRDTLRIQNPSYHVITTDIANFYDTIDVTRMMKFVRSRCGPFEEVVDLLEVFFSFWDRRIKGYKPSSKGIPQELIGDASRLFSHAYLKPFDERFTAYCDQHELTFIRWADDMIVFGKNRAALELAIHRASKLLLPLGLNLNASKTKLYTTSKFKKYRGLDVLDAVANKDVPAFSRHLSKFRKFSETDESRIDTVFRAGIGFLYRNKTARTTKNLEYLKEQSLRYEQVSGLNFSQIKNLVSMMPDPGLELTRIVRLICTKPYSSPKAQIIKSLWKFQKEYFAMGITKSRLSGCVKRIRNSSADSPILLTICLPEYEART